MSTRAFALLRPGVLRGLSLPIVLVAGWALLCAYGLVDTHILVPPQAVFDAAIEKIASGELWEHLGASLARNLAGFALGTTVGLLVGGAMGGSRLVDRLLGPSFHAAKQVALFAWIPLMSVWLGTGEPAKVAFIALSAFYPVVLNTHEGIRGAALDHVEVARVFRFSRWQVLRKVVVPAATPSIFAGVHQALIYSWLGTIGAEYLLQPAPGVGTLMTEGREQFAMAVVLLGIIVTGLVGFGLNAVASAVEGRLLRWRVRSV